jgi:hypothetical protein
MGKHIYYDNFYGEGGVVVLVFPQVVSTIVDWGNDTLQRLLWVLLNLSGYLLGLENVYASNDSWEHANLCPCLDGELPNALWLICTN